MSESCEYRDSLQQAFGRSADAAAQSWLDDALNEIRAGADPESDLLRLSAQARRRLGVQRLHPDVAPIETAGGPLDLAHWSVGDCGRVMLLLEACAAHPRPDSQWAQRLFRHGDESERAAVIRALMLVPAPAAAKPLALEAGRCNSLLLYSALALRNPYPAVHYDDHEFNQVVLKSLFTGLPIELIVGRDLRANPELSAMCEDYAEERLAAARTVPCDIWLAIGPHASARGEQLMLTHLDHDDPGHRRHAAIAIGRRRAERPDLAAALARRLAQEQDAEVLRVLRQQLAH